MRVLVCLFVARTTVHVQRIHSVVVRTYKRPKGRFILHFFAMRQPDARRPATDLRRRRASQTFAKPISQLCVCWFENTLQKTFSGCKHRAAGRGGASTGQPLRLQRLSGQRRTGQR